MKPTTQNLPFHSSPHFLFFPVLPQIKPTPPFKTKLQNNSCDKQEGGIQSNQGAINIIYNQQIMSRQSWTPEEDEAISKLVLTHGIDDWTKIAYKLRDHLGMQKRTGKQCRERWYNHLSPTVNKQPWTDEEEELLFTHHKKYGNRWKDISKLFIGRTDNDIKNHFYSTLRRSLRRLNKIVGEKNSTTQMREIKPSVLSTIMNYIYERQPPNSQLVQSLKDLPLLIFEFAKFKPIKLNIRNANIEMIKEQTNEIFFLIAKFNEQYEQNKEFRRSLKSEKRVKKLALHKTHSEPAEASVKIEESIENQSENIYSKEEQEEQAEEDHHADLFQKMEENYEDKDHHPDHKINEGTEFSLNHANYDSYHEDFTHFGLLNHLTTSPKVTIKEAPVNFPSHNRTFSLEADELHDICFNQPEEPSRMNIQEHAQFQLHSLLPEQKGKQPNQMQLIDEVIETQFKR